jgi:hypothetical protein
MKNPNRFYTYAYLREDGTPYYIGKGNGRRAYFRHRSGLKPPKDLSRIIFLKKNITENEAFKHEIYMIALFGRKDLGTGILHNRTDGGEGTSGRIISQELRRKRSKNFSGEKNPSKRPDVVEKRRKTVTGKKLPAEHCKNIGKSKSGVKWWNNGKITKFCKECPGDEWSLGRKTFP